MSVWKDAYDLYAEIESQWPTTPECKDLLKILLTYNNVERQIDHHKKSGWPLPQAGLLKKALLLRETIEREKSKNSTPTVVKIQTEDIPKEIAMSQKIAKHRSRFSLDTVYDDVYHAALKILLDPGMIPFSPELFGYRGQRHPWPTLPSIYRLLPQNHEAQEFDQRIKRVAVISEILDAKYPGRFDESQRFAIAQHYNVATWLIDLTYHPLVALFFASDKGEEGDIGFILRFSFNEWEKLSSAGRTRLGTIRHIDVKGVPRIEAQKALFLDGAHPSLVEQYVGYSVAFWQKPGLVFEDSSRGITEQDLYTSKQNDEFAALFNSFEEDWKINSREANNSLRTAPSTDTLNPLTPSDYLSMVQGWIENQYKERLPINLSRKANDILMEVCRFHCLLQTVSEECRLSGRGIYNLKRAMEYVVAHDQLNDLKGANTMIFDWIIKRHYLSHVEGKGEDVVSEILSQMDSND